MSTLSLLIQLIPITGLYALVASTFTLAKVALNVSAPFFYVGLRMIFAGVLLTSYYFFKDARAPKRKPTISDIRLFIGIIFFHIYFAYILDLWSLQYISSCDASLIYTLSPFVTAIISFWWFKERLTGIQWFGMVVGFASCVPLIIESNCNPSSLQGIVGMFGSMVASSLGWITFKELTDNRRYSPFIINGVGMVFGGIFALVTSYFTEIWSPTFPVSDWSLFLLYTGMIIIVGNFVVYNAYGYLLRKYSATFLSYAGLTTPIFAALYGWFFLGEYLSPYLIVAIAGIAFGLYCFNIRKM
jgi:drug/metabolite transporter (DMT)-like permease